MRFLTPLIAALLLITGTALPTMALTPPDQVDYVVAQDGTGDFTTVQAAIDAIPAGNTARQVIQIEAGTYREVVTLPNNKWSITLVGATGNAQDVVITYNNSAGTPRPDGSGNYGTQGSATMSISGNNVEVYDLTIENSFQETGANNEQAVALVTQGDKLIFDNVRFIGNQDTLYVKSGSATTVARSYFHDCYIEGDVDFIFGHGTAVFDDCTIFAKSRGSSSNNGYVTAAATHESNPYGFLIINSRIESDAPENSFHLGRPWPSFEGARAQVTIRETYLSAAIKDAPWTDWSNPPYEWEDARYFEYNNYGPGAGVNENRPQLTAEQAEEYTIENYLNRGDGWNPAVNNDETPPTITCDDPDTEWHADNVTITCTASDNVELDNPADASFTLTTNVAAGVETANASTNSREVCDTDNNCTTVGPFTGIRVDRKAPEITIDAPTNATYERDQVVVAIYECTDAGSGVADCNGSVNTGSAIDTSTPGEKTFTVTATDNVGNTVTRSVTYTVVDAATDPEPSQIYLPLILK